MKAESHRDRLRIRVRHGRRHRQFCAGQRIAGLQHELIGIFGSGGLVVRKAEQRAIRRRLDRLEPGAAREAVSRHMIGGAIYGMAVVFEPADDRKQKRRPAAPETRAIVQIIPACRSRMLCSSAPIGEISTLKAGEWRVMLVTAITP